jgi:hypothetical protein
MTNQTHRCEQTNIWPNQESPRNASIAWKMTPRMTQRRIQESSPLRANQAAKLVQSSHALHKIKISFENEGTTLRFIPHWASSKNVISLILRNLKHRTWKAERRATCLEEQHEKLEYENRSLRSGVAVGRVRM